MNDADVHQPIIIVSERENDAISLVLDLLTLYDIGNQRMCSTSPDNDYGVLIEWSYDRTICHTTCYPELEGFLSSISLSYLLYNLILAETANREILNELG